MARLSIVHNDQNPSAEGAAFGFLGAYAPQPTAIIFVTNEGPVSLRVMKLEYESGTPGMLLLEGTGRMTANREAPERRYSAYYNANIGTGWIEFAN